MRLEQPRPGQTATGAQPKNSANRVDRRSKRKPSHDSVSHVELNEADDLEGHLFKFIVRATIFVPVQREMCAQNTAARDGRDVRDLRKDAGVAQESHDPQVIERGAKAATR